MGWVDTHCHLQLDERGADALLDRAPDVDWIVAPGTDLHTSRASIALAEGHPGRVLATVGLHPHDAEKWQEERDAIERLIERAAGVGETGLDFYRNLSDPIDQRSSFAAHIQLAIDHRKPLVVHCRDAFSEVHEMIESSGAGPQTVMHCWTGGPRWSRRFLDLGVTFSFAGPVAFETGETVRLGAAQIPPDRCTVETDTPYLAPPPHRGEPNEPAWVALVGVALAEVWGLAVGDVQRLTSQRAADVFCS